MFYIYLIMPLVMVVFLYSINLVSGNYFAQNLIEDIIRNSSKYVRPNVNMSLPTKVQIRLNLYQMLGADTIQQRIHLHFWAEMSWANDFIRWNASQWKGLDRIDIDPKHIWIPDIQFFEQLEGYPFNEHFPVPPFIGPNGHTTVLKQFKAELACSLSVTYFPFDYQECPFEVGSWAHFAHEIESLPTKGAAADLTFLKNSSIFDIIDFKVKPHRYSDPNLANVSFSSLVFNVKFRRKSTYFVMNVIMPSVMINVLCVLNFVIPCDSGEKVGYGITVFLAQSVNLMVVSEMMPQGGTSILGIFLVVSILLIGLSLLMQVVSLRCFHPTCSRQRPSRIVVTFFDKLRRVVGPSDPKRDAIIAHNTLAKLSIAIDNLDNESIDTSEKNSYNFNGPQSNMLPYDDQEQSSESISSCENNGDFDEFTGNRPNHNAFYNSCSGVFMRKPDITGPIHLRRKGSRSYHNINTNLTTTIAEKENGNGYPVNSMNPRTPEINMPPAIHMEEPDEYEIAEEWRLLAETVNRVNASFFTLLLMIIATLYLVFHVPPEER